MNKRAMLGLGLGALGAFFIACQDGPSTPSAPATESAESASATPSALTATPMEAAPSPAATGPAASAPATGPSGAISGVTSVEGTLDADAPFAAFAAGGGNWDLVDDFTGDGVDDVIGNVLAFNARRLSDGTVQGQWEYQQTFQGEVFRFHGSVSCIQVYDEGTRVKFGGPITRSNDAGLPVGLFGWWTVVDNGDGGSGDLDRSSIIGAGDEQANEEFCASPAPPNPIFSTDVTSGNFRVEG